MSIDNSAQGAVTPSPLPVAQPPGRVGLVTLRLNSLTGAFTAIGVLVAPVGGAVAWSTGYVQTWVDWASKTDETKSQVTAIDERVKVLEGDKAAIIRDREELARIARTLEQTVKDLAGAGVDVRGLSDVQRRLELKVERLDAVLDMLRERRL